MLDADAPPRIPGGDAMIRSPLGSRLALLAFLAACIAGRPAQAQLPLSPRLPAPIAIYSHLPAYGSFSSSAPLNESLALRQVDDLVRLKRAGLRVDYDLMDVAWFAPAGSYVNGPTS